MNGILLKRWANAWDKAASKSIAIITGYCFLFNLINLINNFKSHKGNAITSHLFENPHPENIILNLMSFSINIFGYFFLRSQPIKVSLYPFFASDGNSLSV